MWLLACEGFEEYPANWTLVSVERIPFHRIYNSLCSDNGISYLVLRTEACTSFNGIEAGGVLYLLCMHRCAQRDRRRPSKITMI